MNFKTGLILHSNLNEVAEVKAGEQFLQGAGAAPTWRGASPSTTLADGTLHLLLHQDELEMPNSAIYTALP